MLVLGFDDYKLQGERLAQALQIPFALIEVHRFPDGESKVTLPPNLPRDIVICRSLHQPNDKLIELLLAVQTARNNGVERIVLVAPYLCYMRQDVAFNPGEAISQQIIGRFLAALFDAVITVDPHLHRIEHLEQAVPLHHAVALTATDEMATFLREKFDKPLLIGPDAESEQWVCQIAGPTGFDYAIASKRRVGDRDVRISLPAGHYRGRDIVLVDDMISTGRTLMTITTILKAEGARSIHCLVTHDLSSDETIAQLQQAGISHIWSSDSITQESNTLHLAPLLAGAVRSLLENY